MEPATVVIDNGTGYTKMGYAGNLEPSYIIPSVIATSIKNKPGRMGSSASSQYMNPELDFYIGDEAYSRQQTHDIRYILRAGQICDWEGVEKYWHRSIHSYLKCEPENHRFILTEPPMNTPENREQIAEIMFETFNVKGLFIGVQATLALYAQIAKADDPGAAQDQNGNIGEQDMTGTVIDSGDGVTHIFPVCDGYVISSCVKSIPLAGRDITQYIINSLKDRGEKFPAQDTNEIAARIKEKYGYVCQDVLKEFGKYDKKDVDESGKFIQSAKFKKFIHKTMNNNMVDIDVGYERFLGPEMFFHPEFIHKDWQKPIEEVVDDAIQACPVTYRIKLYNNIVLSGGSTLFKDFDRRLQKQLQKRVDTRMDLYAQQTGQVSKIECSVFQNIVQRYAVWFGGSVLGAQDHFKDICKTREEYAEYGPSICRHNALFNQ